MMSYTRLLIILIWITAISASSDETQDKDVTSHQSSEIKQDAIINKKKNDFQLMDYIFLDNQPFTMPEILRKLNQNNIKIVINNSEMDIQSFIDTHSKESFQIKNGTKIVTLDELGAALQGNKFDYLMPHTVNINNVLWTLPELLDIYGKEFKKTLTINYRNGAEEILYNDERITAEQAIDLLLDKKYLYDHTVLQLNSVPTDFYKMLNLILYIPGFNIKYKGALMSVESFLEKFSPGFKGKIIIYFKGKPLSPQEVTEIVWTFTLSHRFATKDKVVEPWKIIDSLQNVKGLKIWIPELKVVLNPKDALPKTESAGMFQFLLNGKIVSLRKIFSMLDTVGNTVFNNMELLDHLHGVEIEANGARRDIKRFMRRNKKKVEYKVIKDGVYLTLNQIYELAKNPRGEITYHDILEELINQDIPATIYNDGGEYTPEQFQRVNKKKKIPKFTIKLNGKDYDYNSTLDLLQMNSPLRTIQFKEFPDVTIQEQLFKPRDILEELVKLNSPGVLILYGGKFYHPRKFLKIYNQKQPDSNKFAVIKGTQIIPPNQIRTIITVQKGFAAIEENGITYSPFEILEKAQAQNYDFLVMFKNRNYTISQFLLLPHKTKNFRLFMNENEITQKDLAYMIDLQQPLKKEIPRKGLHLYGHLKPVVITNEETLGDTKTISLSKPTTPMPILTTAPINPIEEEDIPDNPQKKPKILKEPCTDQLPLIQRPTKKPCTDQLALIQKLCAPFRLMCENVVKERRPWSSTIVSNDVRNNSPLLSSFSQESEGINEILKSSLGYDSLWKSNEMRKPSSQRSNLQESDEEYYDERKKALKGTPCYQDLNDERNLKNSRGPQASRYKIPEVPLRGSYYKRHPGWSTFHPHSNRPHRINEYNYHQKWRNPNSKIQFNKRPHIVEFNERSRFAPHFHRSKELHDRNEPYIKNLRELNPETQFKMRPHFASHLHSSEIPDYTKEFNFKQKNWPIAVPNSQESGKPISRILEQFNERPLLASHSHSLEIPNYTKEFTNYQEEKPIPVSNMQRLKKPNSKIQFNERLLLASHSYSSEIPDNTKEFSNYQEERPIPFLNMQRSRKPNSKIKPLLASLLQSSEIPDNTKEFTNNQKEEPIPVLNMQKSRKPKFFFNEKPLLASHFHSLEIPDNTKDKEEPIPVSNIQKSRKPYSRIPFNERPVLSSHSHSLEIPYDTNKFNSIEEEEPSVSNIRKPGKNNFRIQFNKRPHFVPYIHRSAIPDDIKTEQEKPMFYPYIHDSEKPAFNYKKEEKPISVPYIHGPRIPYSRNQFYERPLLASHFFNSEIPDDIQKSRKLPLRVQFNERPLLHFYSSEIPDDTKEFTNNQEEGPIPVIQKSRKPNSRITFNERPFLASHSYSSEIPDDTNKLNSNEDDEPMSISNIRKPGKNNFRIQFNKGPHFDPYIHRSAIPDDIKTEQEEPMFYPYIQKSRKLPSGTQFNERPLFDLPFHGSAIPALNYNPEEKRGYIHGPRFPNSRIQFNERPLLTSHFYSSEIPDDTNKFNFNEEEEPMSVPNIRKPGKNNFRIQFNKGPHFDPYIHRSAIPDDIKTEQEEPMFYPYIQKSRKLPSGTQFNERPLFGLRFHDSEKPAFNYKKGKRPISVPYIHGPRFPNSRIQFNGRPLLASHFYSSEIPDVTNKLNFNEEEEPMSVPNIRKPGKNNFRIQFNKRPHFVPYIHRSATPDDIKTEQEDPMFYPYIQKSRKLPSGTQFNERPLFDLPFHGSAIPALNYNSEEKLGYIHGPRFPNSRIQFNGRPLLASHFYSSEIPDDTNKLNFNEEEEPMSVPNIRNPGKNNFRIQFNKRPHFVPYIHRSAIPDDIKTEQEDPMFYPYIQKSRKLPSGTQFNERPLFDLPFHGSAIPALNYNPEEKHGYIHGPRFPNSRIQFNERPLLASHFYSSEIPDDTNKLNFNEEEEPMSVPNIRKPGKNNFRIQFNKGPHFVPYIHRSADDIKTEQEDPMFYPYIQKSRKLPSGTQFNERPLFDLPFHGSAIPALNYNPEEMLRYIYGPKYPKSRILFNERPLLASHFYSSEIPDDTNKLNFNEEEEPMSVPYIRKPGKNNFRIQFNKRPHFVPYIHRSAIPDDIKTEQEDPMFYPYIQKSRKHPSGTQFNERPLFDLPFHSSAIPALNYNPEEMLRYIYGPRYPKSTTQFNERPLLAPHFLNSEIPGLTIKFKHNQKGEPMTVPYIQTSRIPNFGRQFNKQPFFDGHIHRSSIPDDIKEINYNQEEEPMFVPNIQKSRQPTSRTQFNKKPLFASHFKSLERPTDDMSDISTKTFPRIDKKLGMPIVRTPLNGKTSFDASPYQKSKMPAYGEFGGSHVKCCPCNDVLNDDAIDASIAQESHFSLRKEKRQLKKLADQTEEQQLNPYFQNLSASKISGEIELPPFPQLSRMNLSEYSGKDEDKDLSNFDHEDSPTRKQKRSLN